MASILANTATSGSAASTTADSTNKNISYHGSYSYNQKPSCIKFVPQAFNTNKCQQCFNFKELHSTEALAEYSKSNRKVCKYGYLFIAPPDLELNKTKRWQWRFFIFYDDSELTYSLDENPLTLPQGRINISKCQDIIELNNLSSIVGGLISYPNALCLKFSTPNKDIYIAAGNYEDMAKWRDVLMFHCSRHLTNKHNNNNNNLKNYNQQDKNDIKIEEHEKNLKNLTKKGNLTNSNKNSSIELLQQDMDDVVFLNTNDDVEIDVDVEEDVDADEDEEEDENEYEQQQQQQQQQQQRQHHQLDYTNSNENEFEIKMKNNRNLINKIKSSEMQQQNKDAPTTSSSNNNNSNTQLSDESRRLSYKEDDLIRKQRLKENLNQLLIEYKHEEEAHLKKYSKFSSSSSINPHSNCNNSNRTSLDSSCQYSANKINKSSAFSLVVPPQQLIQQNNSAFRPINSFNQNKATKNNTNFVKGSWSSDGSSSSSGSSSSGSSSVSSSNSPPKTRSNTTTNNNNKINVSIEISNNEQQVISAQHIYKKPCLISPNRGKSGQQANSSQQQQDEQSNDNNNKSCAVVDSSSNPTNLTSSMSSSSSSSTSSTSTCTSDKSLTIQVRNDEAKCRNKSPPSIDTTDNPLNNHFNMNELIDLTHNRNGVKQQSICSNISGYLWKNLEKYWFSLNTNSCVLLYWNDKYEQDFGKFPIGKYELTKCTQLLIKDNLIKDDLTFKLILNSHSVLLKCTCKENKSSWCDALKHTIEHLAPCSSSLNCVKCSSSGKPKLVVNPMPLISQQSPNNTSTSHPEESPNTSTLSSSISSGPACKKNHRSTSITPSAPPTNLPTGGSISKMKSSAKESDANESKSTLTSNDGFKAKCDKLMQENQELSSKFKLLEQIHLNTINEYEKQQNRLYNQMDEMHMKNNKSDLEIEILNKKLNQSKQSHEQSMLQIKQLNDNLLKSKDLILKHEKEIERLTNPTAVDQQSENEKGNLLGWNKEVKSLDARITDVLGKIKEREMNLKTKTLTSTTSTQTISLSCCQKLEAELQDAQLKIKQLLQLKQQEKNSINNKASINLNDFSDDLGKVLMSKEEVITQLEKQLKEKEKQIQSLTSQLNDEISQTNKYQDALNTELNRSNQYKDLNENLNQQLEMSSTEMNTLRDELIRANKLVHSLEMSLNQSNADKEKLATDLSSSQEYCKNEMEILQEEIKTFEYKLVHSQRQAQEYQSILEDMDLTNTNAISYLSQTVALSGVDGITSSLSSDSFSSSNNLQNRLKRTQSYVHLLIKQIIQIKNSCIDELTSKLNQMQTEFDELKEENIDLNDHIYSIDVFMREKESQCDQLQKEKDELLILKLKNNNNDSDLSSPYKSFLSELSNHLKDHTKNLNDLSKFVLAFSQYLILEFNQDSIDEQNSIMKINEFISSIDLDKELAIKQAIKAGFSHQETRQALKQLVKFVTSSGLAKFNTQIISYMAEQLIHKAALNGHLKFACELLRKKQHEQPAASASASTNTNTNTDTTESSLNANLTPIKNEQDEKIFKLASELLLSDEDSLRKLSAQVLNEAQHLNQLNCVLNTLKKLRWKNLSINSSSNRKVLSDFLSKLNQPEDDLDDELNKLISDLNSTSLINETSSNDIVDCEGDQLNYVLQIIKNIFIQHKYQITEQLNQVHKLMSISCDDDLVSHLQKENENLYQELNKLKQQQQQQQQLNSSSKNSSSSNWLTQQVNRTSSPLDILASTHQSSTTQLRKFGTLASKSIQQSSATSATQAGKISSDTNEQGQNHHHHHHQQHHHFILTDLLAQDDTLC